MTILEQIVKGDVPSGMPIVILANGAMIQGTAASVEDYAKAVKRILVNATMAKSAEAAKEVEAMSVSPDGSEGYVYLIAKSMVFADGRNIALGDAPIRFARSAIVGFFLGEMKLSATQ